VDACFLHVLHDSADDDLAGVVADRVDIHLGGAREESVDQHGSFRG